MKLCILDADSLLFYCVHNKKDEPEKSFDEIKSKLDTWLLDIFNKTYSTHYYMYLTSSKSFRANEYPEYKAHRKAERPNYFKELKEYMVQNYSGISYPELEADDLCLITYKMHTKALAEGDEVFISSPDKDLLKLEGEHYNYAKDIWSTNTEDDAKYHFWESMITGDSADGVQGIHGKGKKFVEKLFENTTSKDLPGVVFSAYTTILGTDEGIHEFYKSYKMLKILDTHEEFQKSIPEPFEIKREQSTLITETQ